MDPECMCLFIQVFCYLIGVSGSQHHPWPVSTFFLLWCCRHLCVDMIFFLSNVCLLCSCLPALVHLQDGVQGQW